MPPTDRPCVVKVGGSLFDLPILGLCLAEWCQRWPRTLLIAGGGRAADQIREIATLHTSLSEADAHWLAINAMGFQAQVLSAITKIPCYKDPAVLQHSTWATPVLLDPARLLADDNGRSLPIGWHVTSDSIAAFVAQQMGIAHLVLLKSIDVTGDDRHEWAKRGWVDSYFPQAAEGLAVTCLNVRS